uniref:coiled-coil domain-containing protein 32 n=1 Tax=Myxine glutinosa TaxID=7769 RepID=UPI00358EB807
MAEVSSNNSNSESYTLGSDVDPWKPIFVEFQSEGSCSTSNQGFDNNFTDSFANPSVYVQNGLQTQQHCRLPDSEVYLASLERRLQKIQGRGHNLTSHDVISELERGRQDCLAELLDRADDSEPFYEEDIDDSALIQLRRRLQPESVALSAEELQYLLHARKSSSSSLGYESSESDIAEDS